jgi:hypothetical protein
MNECISIQSLINNWHTILPIALLSVEYIMGLIPNSKAKGLSHLALIMYQNYKNAQKQIVYVAPPSPPTPPPGDQQP